MIVLHDFGVCQLALTSLSSLTATHVWSTAVTTQHLLLSSPTKMNSSSDFVCNSLKFGAQATRGACPWHQHYVFPAAASCRRDLPLQKTRKGAVTKVVREHYLRDDIPCGSQACSSCPAPASGDGPVLSPGPGATYVVVDTNVLLHQLDLLEHEGVGNVVLPGVALDETRKRNQAAYARARSLASGGGRRAFVFSNEHHRDTFVEVNGAPLSSTLQLHPSHPSLLHFFTDS